MLNLQRTDTRNARFIRQGISLTGFNNKTFEKAVEGAWNVCDFMANQLKEGEMTPWHPTVVDGAATIDMNNRFFSWKTANASEQVVPIDKKLDPHGTLAKLAGHEYVHTQENQVLYYDCKTDDAGKQK